MPKTTPDIALVLRNGKVLTQDGGEDRVSAVAVGRDGRIAAVGTDDDVAGLIRNRTRIVDLRGRTLIPGFFECHMHMLWLGFNLGQVDLSSPPVRNRQDVIRLLHEYYDAHPDVLCVQGNRYDQNKLEPARHLTRYDLDQVSRSVPVRIEHTSGHASVVNSIALKRLGITADSSDPAGGEIIRDTTGEPTGLLLETASWKDLDRIIPEATPTEKRLALERADRYLLERGVTSASDANTEPGDVETYADAVFHGQLRVRTNCMIAWADVMRTVGTGAVPAPDDLQPILEGLSWHRLHVGQAKLFSDGAITTRTCWLTQPFENSISAENYGIPIHPVEELMAYIVAAHRAGWQIATHAIGDRAIDLVLTCYAEAQRRQTRHRPGHRIEHCMLLDRELIARLRRQNIWSIGQPEFLSNLGDAYIAALGRERGDRLSPYATLEASGVAQAFSSDCPVVPGAPLDGMKSAIERTTPHGNILNASERVSAEFALYAYTAAPAFAARTERDRGSISPGKWADFALLSADPLTTATDEWDAVQVLATFVEGECLYGQEQLDQ